MKTLKTIYTCFPEGKHKCFTMSFDDGRDFDRQLIDLLNQHGIKGTFHLNGGLLGDNTYGERIAFDEIETLYKGHEVSAHTYTHPTIERCPLDQVVMQVLEDRKILEAACGYPVRGMSYPNGSYSDDIIKALPYCGIEYSRVVGGTLGFGMPRDFMEWKSTCHQNHPDCYKLAEEFADLSKTQYLYLMYVWGHSYELEDEAQWNNMKELCSMLGSRDDIWFATNIEIVDYMNGAKRLKYTASGDKVFNPSAMPIWISVDNEKMKINGGEMVCI